MACDDAFIDPFANDGNYFTVYGFLDQSKNFEIAADQVLRVIPVTRLPERIESPADEQAFIDAQVFTTNLNTQETVTWRHSLERLDNGFYGHIFRARFFVRPGHTYRLEVIRSDGITAIAETTVPVTTATTPIFSEPVVSFDTTQVQQSIFLPGLRSIWKIDMLYRLSGPECGPSSPVTLAYGRAGSPSANGWAIDIDLTADKARLAEQFGAGFSMCAMGIRAEILDNDWQFPVGELDIETRANPDVLSNVENGYGYFGSIGVYQADWPLSDALQALLNRPGL